MTAVSACLLRREEGAHRCAGTDRNTPKAGGTASFRPACRLRLILERSRERGWEVGIVYTPSGRMSRGGRHFWRVYFWDRPALNGRHGSRKGRHGVGRAATGQEGQTRSRKGRHGGLPLRGRWRGRRGGPPWPPFLFCGRPSCSVAALLVLWPPPMQEVLPNSRINLGCRTLMRRTGRSDTRTVTGGGACNNKQARGRPPSQHTVRSRKRSFV